jgi:hypothetical protein
MTATKVVVSGLWTEVGLGVAYAPQRIATPHAALARVKGPRPPFMRLYPAVARCRAGWRAESLRRR